ncbi:MAG: 5'-nucleotidase C-terminal domain-containing protein [Acetatifactor sp.]|nr:5'-nucleotidase C-terminal domain-containing protein [Acetatifactor sp.]
MIFARSTGLRRLTTAAAAFVLSLTLAVGAAGSVHAETRDIDHNLDSKVVDIIFTHDTHSHLDEFATIDHGERTLAGGFGAIKTVINGKMSKNPDTLVVDAGDFSMGTLLQSIYDKESTELRMLGNIGCEVTTLGNHEFDYRSEGLAGALNVARESGDPLPAMVLSNLDWASMEKKGLTPEQQMLKDAFDAYGMKEYTVITKGDVKIGIFGLFGIDSLACAPTCVLEFRDCIEAATEVVAKLKTQEDVDLVLCISHSGTVDNPKKSEDELLAKAVPEIDFIVSGHTHTTLEEPIVIKNTAIGSCGEYGKYVGSVSLMQEATGRWSVSDYELIPIVPSIPEDEATQSKVDEFFSLVDSVYLKDFGYTRKQVLAQNDIVFSTSPDLYTIHTDHNLGNLLSDAFYYAVSNSNTGDSHTVDAAIVPSGCVRDTFAKGDITVEDVFNAYSLGIGPDKVAGYPLLSFYLTGAELKTGAEIDASVSDLMDSARLFIHGVNFTYNPHRILLNKVTDCYLTDADGNRKELENNTLYRVVCDLYSGQMLGAVTDVSYGILKVQPKFADGTPIENIEDAIITCDGKELKAWAAIASYMESFSDADGDGIPNVPASYGELHGRKVVEENRDPISILKNPNKYSIVILLVILILITLLILLVRFIVKRIRIRRQKKRERDAALLENNPMFREENSDTIE